ncbi:MAG: hypothetical protein GPJ54_05110 [Candidatus Heimdallarchaeota archaeon]|nr:hypothetical protein [Candidatus Heimdallarchaeota archaeon]
MHNGSDGSVCQKCESLITDLAEALLKGCPTCHHRRFKFIKKSARNMEGLKQSLDSLFNENDDSQSVGVGIKIVDRGTFKIDLKTLTENNETQDPIIVQDTKGVINIILESE